MDIATEEGPTGLKTEKMSMPSAFCVKTAEPEDGCDSLKAERSLGTEALPTSSYDNNQVTCVKVEPVTDAEQVGNRVQVISPVMKHKHQDGCDSLKAERSLGTEAHPKSSYDNNQVICVRVEPVTDAEQVGNRVQIISPAMKREHQDTLREQETTGLGGRIYYYCKGCCVTFAARSELESHPCLHAVENKSTWTSLRNSYAGPSGEERNMPRGPRVERNREEEDAEAMQWGRRRRRRRMRMPNFEFTPLRDDVSQQIRFGSNRNATLMGDLEGSSPRHGEAAEGTQHSAANVNTGQNCDAFQALPVFKKLKSDSALDLESYCLRSKTEHQEHDDADHCFLQSLIPDMKKLSDRKKRKFKQLMMSSMCTLLDEQEYEAHASNNAHRFRHPSAIDTLQQVMHLS